MRSISGGFVLFTGTLLLGLCWHERDYVFGAVSVFYVIWGSRKLLWRAPS